MVMNEFLTNLFLPMPQGRMQKELQRYAIEGVYQRENYASIRWVGVSIVTTPTQRHPNLNCGWRLDAKMTVKNHPLAPPLYAQSQNLK